MNSKFLSLLKVHFLGFFGINRMLSGKNAKKKTASIYGLVALLGALICIAIGYYASIFMSILGESSSQVVFPTMYLMLVSGIFFYFLISARGNLYGSKDFETLCTFPIKKSTIVSVKLTALYMFAVLISAIIFVPVMVVYAISFAKFLTVQMVFSYIVLILVGPAVPFSLAIILSSVVSLLVSKLKRKNIIEIVCTTVLIMLIFVGMALFTMGDSNVLLNLTDGIFICQIYVKALNNIVTLLLFCLVSIAFMLIMVIFVSKIFTIVNAKLRGVSNVKSKKSVTFNATLPKIALYKKEFKTLFSYPIYALNTLLGLPICVVMIVVFTIIFKQINISGTIAFYIAIFAPVLLSFCLNMCPLTCASISMEGKAIWLIKTMPFDGLQFLNIKLLANYTIFVPSAIIFSVITAIIYSVEFLTTILMVLTVVSSVLFCGASALLYNLMRPTFNWDNPQSVVKQSMPVLFSVITCFVSSVVMAVISIFVSVISAEFALLMQILLFTCLTFLCYYLILSKGNNVLSKLN